MNRCNIKLTGFTVICVNVCSTDAEHGDPHTARRGLQHCTAAAEPREEPLHGRAATWPLPALPHHHRWRKQQLHQCCTHGCEKDKILHIFSFNVSFISFFLSKILKARTGDNNYLSERTLFTELIRWSFLIMVCPQINPLRSRLMLFAVFRDLFSGHRVLNIDFKMWQRQGEINWIRRRGLSILLVEMIDNVTPQFNLGTAHEGRTGVTDMDIPLTRVTFSNRIDFSVH